MEYLLIKRKEKQRGKVASFLILFLAILEDCFHDY